MGVGGLLVRGRTRLSPLFHGGGQERGLRPGTENVNGIVQMAEVATMLSKSLRSNHDHVAQIKAEIAALATDLPDVFINVRTSETSPYILNMSFLGINGETLVHLLSEKGIYASMGAACRSRKRESSLLEVMGFSRERAQTAVRFSFSHLNTLEEAATARAVITECVMQLRRMLRY